MAPRRGKVYKVILVPPDEEAFFAVKGGDTPFQSPGDYNSDALSAGSRTERYGRKWIIGGTHREDDVLTGRIGFRGAEGMAEVWGAQFVEQSQTHVERGYGEARYVGIRDAGTSEARETVYNSSIGSEEESVDVAVGEEGEVSQRDLSDVLAETHADRSSETSSQRH